MRWLTSKIVVGHRYCRNVILEMWLVLLRHRPVTALPKYSLISITSGLETQCIFTIYSIRYAHGFCRALCWFWLDRDRCDLMPIYFMKVITKSSGVWENYCGCWWSGDEVANALFVNCHPISVFNKVSFRSLESCSYFTGGTTVKVLRLVFNMIVTNRGCCDNNGHTLTNAKKSWVIPSLFRPNLASSTGKVLEIMG